MKDERFTKPINQHACIANSDTSDFTYASPTGCVCISKADLVNREKMAILNVVNSSFQKSQ